MVYLYKNIKNMNDGERERFYLELLSFMSRTTPLYFTDTEGDVYCLIHSEKTGRYTTTFINGYTAEKLYNEAIERGVVNGQQQLHILSCMSLGLGSDCLNDDRCTVDVITQYPIAFGWENGGSNPSGLDSYPTEDSEFCIGVIENDQDFVNLIKHSTRLQNAGLTENIISWLKVYKEGE